MLSLLVSQSLVEHDVEHQASYGHECAQTQNDVVVHITSKLACNQNNGCQEDQDKSQIFQ